MSRGGLTREDPPGKGRTRSNCAWMKACPISTPRSLISSRSLIAFTRRCSRNSVLNEREGNFGRGLGRFARRRDRFTSLEREFGNRPLWLESHCRRLWFVLNPVPRTAEILRWIAGEIINKSIQEMGRFTNAFWNEMRFCLSSSRKCKFRWYSKVFEVKCGYFLELFRPWIYLK